ncbi:hypothetical protein GlitD10_2377 [Gloeomargarita lithophora Alchichica-D10]|uniref:Uncharacterized protein n=1 Tax=Gloeomargarita lithophora Alchichica-D10 TaxID=1188229 RepID=A0A1J0AFL6_9CYAN|nr:hypothetical protein [Gloeomargarita lithophora]APB34711.1 hypothetical protein GlitD10_2377 [Gloeomargarita lithophora Alchichica-D10]
MPNTPETLLQQGFRVALGCAGTVVEWVQDEQKRQTQLQQWQQDMEQVVQELVTKGEKTEVEAREFVAQLFNRTSPPPASPPVEVEVTSSSAPAAAAELQDLTNELSSLRESLEQSRPNE